MILRALALGLVLLTMLLVETVLGPTLSIAGIAPDLVVVSVLVVGVQQGPGNGLRYGFAAGLAMDLLGSPDSILGTSALVLLLFGYAAGVARPYLAGGDLLGQTLVAAGGTAAVAVAHALLTFVLGMEGVDMLGVVLDALGRGLYALFVAPPLAWLVGRASRGLSADSSSASHT